MQTMQPDAFKRWVNTAQPGSKVIYHTGHLAAQREGLTTVIEDGSTVRFVHEFFEPYHSLGKVTYQAYEDGKVFLVQHRVGENLFDYVAIKRKRA